MLQFYWLSITSIDRRRVINLSNLDLDLDKSKVES